MTRASLLTLVVLAVGTIVLQSAPADSGPVSPENPLLGEDDLVADTATAHLVLWIEPDAPIGIVSSPLLNAELRDAQIGDLVEPHEPVPPIAPLP
jgi:hypothetical protein